MHLKIKDFLTPTPAAGIRAASVFLGAALLAMPAPASAQAGLNGQLAACLKVFGAVERLACYDRLAHAAMGQVPPPAAPSPAVVPQNAPPPTQSFGSEQMRQPATAETARLSSEISGISVNPLGKFTVTLTNGQVWQQLESDSRTVRPRKSMHSVRISRGMMGSYDLQFDDSSVVYKVRRTR